MLLEQWLPNNELGQEIWARKYQFKDESFDQWLDRVSNNNQELRQLIVDKKFLFGGRILAGRNTSSDDNKICLSNCFCLPKPQDNLESIFDTAKYMARTFSTGGGVGIDVSELSPRGAKLRNAAKSTTGAVSFLKELYSMVSKLISQKGRRGALMISIGDYHPDIEEFIELKTNPDTATGCNMSIRFSDKFMTAVERDDKWVLSFHRKETNHTIERTIQARELFRKIAEANWDWGEPGMLFWDKMTGQIIQVNDDEYVLSTTNPCGELGLVDGGACNLASVNLSEFVINPFDDNCSFDFDGYKESVRLGIQALDNIIDENIPLLPLQIQRDASIKWRSCGLGVFGIADMLIKLKLKYDSQEAIDFCKHLSFILMNESLKTSALLAKEYGTYPGYKKENVINNPFVILCCGGKDSEVYELICKYGLRNAQLLAIAPTGTLSTMFGISGGIEPIYNYGYSRKTESLHGTDVYYKVYTPIVQFYISKFNLEDESQLPEYFTNAMLIDPMKRIEMQAAWQMHLDNSISSTINLNNDATVEDVEKLYMYSWKQGLKGMTIFRDGCKRLGILTSLPTTAEIEDEEMDEIVLPDNVYGLRWGEKLSSRDDMIGKKRTLTTGCGTLHLQAWYHPITGKLIEVWLAKGSTGGCQSYMVGLSRILSLACKSGASIDDVVDQLMSVPVCASYNARTITKRDTSKGINCPSSIGYALKALQEEVDSEVSCHNMLSHLNYDLNVDTSKHVVSISNVTDNNVINEENKCPSCKEKITFANGCMTCQGCGWSKCD